MHRCGTSDVSNVVPHIQAHLRYSILCVGGGGPYPDGAPDAAAHLRNVFYRMGLSDQEIVVLSGAHTLGRSYPHRSGFGMMLCHV